MTNKINNLHVSVNKNGLRTTREADNLENFFNDMPSGTESIIQLMQKDIQSFISMPEVLYNQTTTRKRVNKKTKPIASKKKPRKKTTLKK
jgi:hypothetical protein